MRRVVITGIGLVTPLGNSLESTWSNLLAGKSGAAPITHFDCTDYATQFACEVKDWDATPFVSKRDLRHLDLFLQYSIAAGFMALDDAGYTDRRVPEGEEDRWGVYVGSGLGGVITIENTHDKVKVKGPRYGFSPYFVTDLIINMAPGLLSIKVGAEGPNFSHVSACSTGAHSIGEAGRAIKYGDADVMIAGGTEATISVLGVGGFNAMRALSTRNDEPTRASRPFDAERDGFVIAEGAGIVILEELEHAKKRGAKIYAELAGYCANSDAHHITAPAPGGRGAVKCMTRALADARIDPAAIGYINAHGTSTAQNDKNETAAIKSVFGEHAHKLAVSSTKSMTGHMLGAAGGAETAISALAIHNGVLPPTINYENPDPECDLDYVPNEAREAEVRVALSNSSGFGGQNVCLVFEKSQG